MKPRDGEGKKLLVILNSLCAEGTPVLTLDLCRHWMRMGIDPEVLVLSPTPTDLEPEFMREGISVSLMNFPNVGRARYGRMVAFVYSFCRKRTFDALLSMPLGWHCFLLLGARLAGVRATAAHVGNYPAVSTGTAFTKFRWLVQAGRPVTTKLICCSEYVQRGVVQHFRVPERETEVIYNGVDVAEIARRASAGRAARRDGRPFTVGMVARFEVHKDQPTLIRAAKQLREQGRAVEVWLIGDGTRRAEYERLIAELQLEGSVKLLGVRRDVPELLGQLDAFAFAATPEEGLGVALIEAMVAGVPVVATDVGACREVLDGGELGTLVPAKDASALAEAIARLQDDAHGASERTERSRRKAVQAFAIESMAASYARCLRIAPRVADGCPHPEAGPPPR